MQSESREKILKRIKVVENQRPLMHHATEKTPVEDTTIYKPIEPDTETCFRNELESINGHCIFCSDENDLYLKLQTLLRSKSIVTVFCKDRYITEQLQTHQISCTDSDTEFESMVAGITACEFLIARTGSVMVSSASSAGRAMHIFPPVHIVLAHKSQLVDYPADALKAIQSKYGNELPSLISTITGPSRTADIEKTLVLGAHGPKEIFVLISGF